MVLYILLCETKTGFRNHRNNPRTWFRCWNVATPTCLLVCVGRWKLKNQTLSGRRTWTVDEIEAASSLNFSILVECSVLNACECVDFVSSPGFRGSR